MQFDIVYDSTEGYFTQRQRITNFRSNAFSTKDYLIHLDAVGSHNVPFFTIFVLNQCNACRAVWIVFYGFNSGFHSVFIAFEINHTVASFVPTTTVAHSHPTFVVDEVVHYCVANMPGAVGRTSTYALCNATLPWVAKLADVGAACVQGGGPLREAVNIHRGKIFNDAVAAAMRR